MPTYELICVKFDKLKIDEPYCMIIGRRINFKFKPDHIVFSSKEDFEKYCDAITTIYEPHERPNIIFI